MSITSYIHCPEATILGFRLEKYTPDPETDEKVLYTLSRAANPKDVVPDCFEFNSKMEALAYLRGYTTAIILLWDRHD